ncbi:MAG: xanthine dehydrogenase family protein [Elusimicrobia bacterium]|nr:xanthine dehydrogenase family protein [Elusimicrobiota bacterium]
MNPKVLEPGKLKKGFAVITKPLTRPDSEDKVTGRAVYADDLNMPGALFARQVYSEHPHAIIKNVDTSLALKYPGVKAVITGQDAPGKKTYGNVIEDQPAIAFDKVRHMGDVVAVVAAETERQARAAAALVKVDYEILPGIFDPREAMKEGAPLLYEEKKTNVQIPQKVRNGDIEKGFSEADIIIEEEFTTPFVEHSYLEPEAALAFIDSNGSIRLKGSFQNPFTARRVIAEFLGIGKNRVRIQKTTLGGSFGGKDEIMSGIGCRLALLTSITGRPVRMANSREDSFVESHKRHPFYMKYKVGAKKDGRLCAVKSEVVVDSGAYCSMGPYVALRGIVQGAGPYKVDNVYSDGFSVYTNNPYAGAMRGFGSPQTNVAIEAIMDILAEKLNIDPVEIRLRNVIEKGDKSPTGQVMNHESGLREALETAAESIKWEEKHEKYSVPQEGPLKKGIGIACCMRGVSLGAEGLDAAAASVSVQDDGSVIVTTGISDHGQGSQGVMTQIVAEVLGINASRVIYFEPDTALIPDSGPTVASRGTFMGGNAVKDAAEKVKAKLLKIAAELLETPENKIYAADDIYYAEDNPDIIVGFEDLVDECTGRAVPLFDYGWYVMPHIHWDEEEGVGDAYYTYVYSVNAAEVTVDTETGKVTVDNFVASHNSGRALNPTQFLGQMFGGSSMGIGFALYEELELEEGRLQTLNFDKYTLPTACDLPEFVGHIVERPDPEGPFGAKSLGEPATEVAAAAVLNALAQATGNRVQHLPASLERVLLGKKLTKKKKT